MSTIVDFPYLFNLDQNLERGCSSAMKGAVMVSSKNQRAVTEGFATLVKDAKFPRGSEADSPITQSHEEITKHIDRLSRELMQISTRLGNADKKPPTVQINALDAQSHLTVIRKTISARLEREKHFPADLFAEPAWDMMLELFHSEICQRRTTVSSLCKASRVPATTALRWIKTLTDAGIFVRRADPLDRRRIFVEMSHKTSCGMHAYIGMISRH